MSHRIKRFSLLLIVLNCYLMNKVASQTQNDILNKLSDIAIIDEKVNDANARWNPIGN